MAAEARREYVAIFAIGGKLLGSFKGAMGMAQARLRALHTRVRASSAAMVSGFKRVAGAVKMLTASFAALGAVFATFLAANIIGKIFGQATDQAKEANERTRSLIGSFMRVKQMSARGLPFTEKIIRQLKAQNQELEKSGVLSSDIYDNFTVSLAALGFSPKRIADSNALLGDMLVRWKGIYATEEDSKDMMENLRKVIQAPKPQMKAFMKMFPEVGPDEIDRFKNAQTREERLKVILDIGKAYKGMNEQALATEPGAKMQQFQNLLRSMAEDIGQEVLPAQDKMAEAWTRLLPKIKPILNLISRGFLRGMEMLGDFVESTLIPLFEQFMAFMRGPFAESFGKVWPKFQEMLGKIGAAFAKMLSGFTGQKKFDFGQLLLTTMDKLGAAFKWVGDNADWLVPLVTKLTIAWIALNAVLTITNTLMLTNPVGWIMLGIAAAILMAANWKLVVKWLRAAWDKLKEAVPLLKWINDAWDRLKAVPIIGDIMTALEDLYKWLLKFFINPLGAIKDAWDGLVWLFNNSLAAISDTFSTIKKYILEFIEDPIKAIYNRWKEFRALIGLPIKVGDFEGGGGTFGGVGAGSSWGAPTAGAPTGFPTAAGAAAAIGGAAGPLAAAAGGAMNAAGAMPVTVASYGGPTEPGQTVGAYNNRLGPGDVAISPNLYPILGKPGPNNYVMLDGKRYHVADASFYTPGNPTSNMVEIWGYGNQIKRAGMVAKAFADGGIATRPTLATIAEQGPEAVLPLSRLGSVGGATTTTVTFAPNITINGNASEAEQRAMDSRLRDLSRDFISEFKRAQQQERRLSYESGYAN